MSGSNWCILQKLSWLKFLYQIYLMEMVSHPQTYPLIPKIPLEVGGGDKMQILDSEPVHLESGSLDL